MNKIDHQSLLKYLFVLIVLVFSLGQLQRWQLTPGVALYFHDILIVIWLSTFALTQTTKLKSGWQKLFSWLRKQPWLVGLISWVVLGMLAHFINSGFNDITPGLYLLRAVTYLSFAIASRSVVAEALSLRSLWTTAGFLILVLGLLQYLIVPDTRFLYILGWDDHYYRLVSSLFDPAFTGMMLVLTFGYFYSLSLFPQSADRHWDFLKRPVAKVACLLALSIGVLLTYSRSSLLALGVVLSSLVLLPPTAAKRQKVAEQGSDWRKKLLMTIGLGLPVLIVVFLLAPKPGGLGVNFLRTATINARMQNAGQAFNNITPQTLVLGEGLFTRTVANPSHVGVSHAGVPDNLLVMLLVATGVPGLLLSLYGFYFLGKKLYQYDRVLLAVFLGLLIHTQFNNTLLQPFVLLYFLGGLSSISARDETG